MFFGSWPAQMAALSMPGGQALPPHLEDVRRMASQRLAAALGQHAMRPASILEPLVSPKFPKLPKLPGLFDVKLSTPGPKF